MLDDQKLSSAFGANHKWEHSESRDRACIFTTDVNKNWASGFICTVLLVEPVALFVSKVTLVVQMVNFAVPPSLGEI